MDRTKPWRDYAVVMLDVETGGLDPEVDRVVEIAAVRFEPPADADDGNELGLTRHGITGVVSGLVNPGRSIPKEASDIHGITDEMVVGAPVFGEAWPKVLALFDENTIAAAYNAPFDRAFLRAEAERCQEPLPLPKGENPIPVGLRMPWLDPLVWVREADRFAKGQGRHKLGVTCERWGIALEDGHKAEDDAIAAGRLMLCPLMRGVVEKFAGRGPSLVTVLAAQAKLEEAQDERHRAFQKQQEASRGKAAQCKSCGAAIVWVTTDAGRAMPVDAAPNLTAGNILVSGDGRSGRVLTGAGLEMARGKEILHLSHFVSCPQAKQHRAPRRSR